jgi:hypothetical protein
VVIAGDGRIERGTGGPDYVDSFVERAAAFIRAVHGVAPPNEAAERFVLGLAAALERFEETRDLLRFEDEPGGFEAALLATKEPHERAE